MKFYVTVVEEPRNYSATAEDAEPADVRSASCNGKSCTFIRQYGLAAVADNITFPVFQECISTCCHFRACSPIYSKFSGFAGRIDLVLSTFY